MDKDDDFVVIAATALCSTIAAVQKLKRKNKIKHLWSRPWLLRRNNNECNNVLKMLNEELKTEDPNAYKNFLRMTDPQLETLYQLLKDDIEKTNTLLRESISGRIRLQVTLRFLATGEIYRSLMYASRIHETTISKFIPEVCNTIYNRLKSTYLQIPKTPQEWDEISRNFENMWQLPNCIGAMDGKHIKFRAPISEGSYYINYKKDHSIVLLALVDASYKFTYVNIGVNGRVSDGGVFQNSRLCAALSENKLNCPNARSLPGRVLKIPNVIVADDAFPLTTKVMKPYPGRNLTHDNKIFNYRLSRARRVVENAFGIFANRFRILLTTINLSPHKVQTITLACIVLHNFLMEQSSASKEDEYSSNNASAGVLRSVSQQNFRSSTTAIKVRDELRDYFNSPAGKLEWQEASIQKHNL